MSKSVNKAILLGNAGKDPEIRAMPSGTKVATWSLATSERYKDNEGNWQDSTEWHTVVAYARLADKGFKTIYRRQDRDAFLERCSLGREEVSNTDQSERFGVAEPAIERRKAGAAAPSRATGRCRDRRLLG